MPGESLASFGNRNIDRLAALCRGTSLSFSFVQCTSCDVWLHQRSKPRLPNQCGNTNIYASCGPARWTLDFTRSVVWNDHTRFCLLRPFWNQRIKKAFLCIILCDINFRQFNASFRLVSEVVLPPFPIKKIASSLTFGTTFKTKGSFLESPENILVSKKHKNMIHSFYRALILTCLQGKKSITGKFDV